MTSPLIQRLTDCFGWPRLDDMAAIDAFCARPGYHCLFVPGDPAKNLETNDAAVILPELIAAFPGRFDGAVVGDAVERALRERVEVWPTPSLLFFEAGRYAGAIPKVRDWDDYLTRLGLILAGGSPDSRTAAAE